MGESQSTPSLAISGDFSDDFIEDIISSENEYETCTCTTTASTSISESESKTTLTPSTSASTSSSHVNLNNTNTNTNSLMFKYFYLPSCSIIFLALLPFVNGCLWTVGHRMGRHLIKELIFKKMLK